MASFSSPSPPCAFFIDVEWRHDKGVYQETLRLPELEIVLSARYRHEPALSTSTSSSSSSSSSPPPPPSSQGRIVWSELGSALLAVTVITTGTMYTIGRSAMREWMAPHTTPDAFPGGVLASSVGTEIVAAVSLLVANDEANGGLVFSCRGRIHTAVAYYAPSSGRDRYAGLHEACQSHRATSATGDAVDARASSNPSTRRRPTPPPTAVHEAPPTPPLTAVHEAPPTPPPTAVHEAPPTPPAAVHEAPPTPPPTAVHEAPPDTEADDIRRRVELLKVYRDLCRRGYDSPELAEYARRVSMTTDELAFEIEMLKLHEKRSETVTAKTEFCKLAANPVTAP